MQCTRALIGYGEAGSIFAAAARGRDGVTIWDHIPERREVAASSGLYTSPSPAEVLSSAPLVLSLVTADQSLSAAEAYAPLPTPGALWCDMNSESPETKRAAASAIEAAGGRYNDVAVLAPVEPARLGVSLLISGDAADEALLMLRSVGFENLRLVGPAVNRRICVRHLDRFSLSGKARWHSTARKSRSTFHRSMSA